MPIFNIFERLDGMLALVSKEKMPNYLFQKIINWEIGEKIGWLVKRKPYKQITTQYNDSHLKNVNGIIEFIDANDLINLVFQSHDSLRLISITSGSYGISSAITGSSNDKRTSGSTISPLPFYPISIFKELRSGAGIDKVTDKPWWYGYIKDRKRYYDPAQNDWEDTINNDKYLDNQFYNEKLLDLFGTSHPIFLSQKTCDLSGAGISEAGYIAIYLAPVIDEYQRGFPYLPLRAVSNTKFAANSTIEIYITIPDENALLAPRITALDLFVSISDQPLIGGQLNEEPVYFLERIYFDKISAPIVEKVGSVDHSVPEIVIDNYADWLTFRNVGLWIHNKTDNEWYYADTYTTSGTSIRILLNTLYGQWPTKSGSNRTFIFYSSWVTLNGFGSNTDRTYTTFYDNHYKKLGSEMYTHLRIPVGDTGIENLRYKYIAWNGNRSLVAGLPAPEKHRAYYSTLNSPDIIPSLNRINADAEITGITTIGLDFLIFTKNQMERHYILSNENSKKDLVDIERGLVSQKALAKISDYVIAGFDYKGPWILSGREFQAIGDQLFEWWFNKLTDTVKDGCITFYNFLKHQIWFSFPDYNDSTFTKGITFIYDLKARERGFLSPWWLLNSNISLHHFCQNYNNHLLAINKDSTNTKLVDFSEDGFDESVGTKLQFKMLQNPLLGRKVRWSKLRVDIRGIGREAPADSVNCHFYFDEETHASLSLSLNTNHFRSIIKYISETLEVEIETEPSTNDLIMRSASLTFTPKR